MSPEMLYADTYMRTARVRLSSLISGMTGWRVGRPNRTSAYYDMLMSRWLDDELIASRPDAATLKIAFRGSTALLFGEGTPSSGRYRVRIDDDPWSSEYDPGSIARPSNGNAHHVQLIAQGLNGDRYHQIEIQPLLREGEELRLGSLCVAGGSNPRAKKIILDNQPILAYNEPTVHN
jgi:hypothetical protein